MQDIGKQPWAIIHRLELGYRLFLAGTMIRQNFTSGGQALKVVAFGHEDQAFECPRRQTTFPLVSHGPLHENDVLCHFIDK